MVKRLLVLFDDEEYKELLTKKGKKTWREFIIDNSNFLQKQ
jgi:hypothetical protein